ncbi:MAG: hypothetical protein AAGF45_05655 [Pseudomonadota bacterium]
MAGTRTLRCKLTLRVFVPSIDFWTVKRGITQDAKLTMEREQVSLPFPARAVVMKGNANAADAMAASAKQ